MIAPNTLWRSSGRYLRNLHRFDCHLVLAPCSRPLLKPKGQSSSLETSCCSGLDLSPLSTRYQKNKHEFTCAPNPIRCGPEWGSAGASLHFGTNLTQKLLLLNQEMSREQKARSAPRSFPYLCIKEVRLFYSAVGFYSCNFERGWLARPTQTCLEIETMFVP